MKPMWRMLSLILLGAGLGALPSTAGAFTDNLPCWGRDRLTKLRCAQYFATRFSPAEGLCVLGLHDIGCQSINYVPYTDLAIDADTRFIVIQLMSALKQCDLLAGGNPNQIINFATGQTLGDAAKVCLEHAFEDLMTHVFGGSVMVRPPSSGGGTPPPTGTTKAGSVQMCASYSYVQMPGCPSPLGCAVCHPVQLVPGSDDIIPPFSTCRDASTCRPARVCDGIGCRTLTRPRGPRRTSRSVLTPATPAVTASPASTTRISLTWNAGSRIRAYNVYRGETLIQTVSATTTSFVDGAGADGTPTAPLSPNTNYCYSVAAIGSLHGFMSARSPLACARTESPLTITGTYWRTGGTAPQTVTVTQDWTCSGFCLPPGFVVHPGEWVSWSVSGGTGGLASTGILDANGFGLLHSQVCSGSGCGGQYSAFCLPGGTNGGHPCFGSLPTGRPDWLDGITVSDGAGHGVAMTIVIKPYPAMPTVPGNLQVFPEGPSPGQLLATWSDSFEVGDAPLPAVAGYKVYRDGAEVGTVAAGGSPYFWDGGLVSNNRYCYTVAAYDSAGTRSAPCAPLCRVAP